MVNWPTFAKATAGKQQSHIATDRESIEEIESGIKNYESREFLFFAKKK